MKIKIKYKGQEIEYAIRIEKESFEDVAACLIDDIHTSVEVRK